MSLAFTETALNVAYAAHAALPAAPWFILIEAIENPLEMEVGGRKT